MEMRYPRHAEPIVWDRPTQPLEFGPFHGLDVATLRHRIERAYRILNKIPRKSIGVRLALRLLEGRDK